MRAGMLILLSKRGLAPLSPRCQPEHPDVLGPPPPSHGITGNGVFRKGDGPNGPPSKRRADHERSSFRSPPFQP
ncbi:MAG: hypothetical protein MZV64_12000 [Ignavibacteriales bacterium]|nr:hypothetical protein [Ignavibacteriales bacterium]